jgi:thiamine-monophosphate kinase
LSACTVDELAVIRDYFTRPPGPAAGARVGVGDDAAVLIVAPGRELVVTTDVLVAGRHFPVDTDPFSIGHKSLAVNLSDLAAMGAEPAWFTLGLAIPAADPDWLSGFSRGLFQLADRFGVSLVGGDTVSGPLTVAIQAAGTAPAGTAVLRRGAAPGDRIYVTGTVGDAGLALAVLAGGAPAVSNGDLAWLRARLERPLPRVREGIALRGLASAMIDVSDGVAADLGHVLEASGVAARVQLESLPLSDAVRRSTPRNAAAAALCAGDDYELCFTVAATAERRALDALCALECPCTRIGDIVAGAGLQVLDAQGRELAVPRAGFDHFAGPAT